MLNWKDAMPLNLRMAEDGATPGSWLPRVTVRQAYKRGKVNYGARVLVRCGCCDQRVELCPDEEIAEHSVLEVNGVSANIQNWRNILLPMLGFEFDGEKWVDKI